MNLIIPMAGRGTRLRPQTLTTPKPLIEIAGRTIVQRIVDLVAKESRKKIKNIGFILEKKDVKIEKMLQQVAHKNHLSCRIFYQGSPQGTAHAIYSAKELLSGPILIVFSDTIFETKLDFSSDSDGCIFVKEVEDPSAYGVVKTNSKGHITDFIEKPTRPTSNLAIVGMYFFKNGQYLLRELKYILDEKIIEKGEYQLTTALENLKNKNLKFTAHKINKWLDFGTPKTLLSSHKELLKTQKIQYQDFSNTIIKPPCFIDSGVVIKDSKIGPNVSIGKDTVIASSVITDTIIQSNCTISGAHLKNSIIGKFVEYSPNATELNIGDYSTLKK
tara:strand:- start:539 stop:1528 length:990 start_codon:yes stop_codon:yes gene_type:complete